MKVPAPVKSFEIDGKEYSIAKLKAKHLIAIETGFPGIGDIQKGLRVIALLMLESMGTEALSYDELIDMELDQLKPLLDSLN